jgi:hypothetical protein
MSKPRRNSTFVEMEAAPFQIKARKAVPHAFVPKHSPSVARDPPHVGCVAVYLGEKIVLILRDKPDKTADNGVWLATAAEHHQSLRHQFPNMRSIKVFKKKVTDWQVLSADAPDSEAAALRACELILVRDPRIGKVPRARRMSGSHARNVAKSSKQTKASKRPATGRARF